MNSKFLLNLLLLLNVIFWITPLFTTPTFDLDEALYRQSAQEMKQSHDYFKITWSGKPFYEKPPLHMWTIVAASYLIDHDKNTVSVVASKLPSVLSTFLCLFFACVFWKKTYPLLRVKTNANVIPAKAGTHDFFASPLLPVVFFGWALLPTAGISCVIIDPMLMAALSPFFLCTTYLYLKGNGKLFSSDISIPFSFKVTMCLSMAISCMLKGPIGLLLPALSVVFHECASFIFQKEEKTRTFLNNRLWNYSCLFFPIFFIALLLSALYYLLIYIFAGYDFIYEFFIVQNIKRGLTPFESHGGPFFYHALVVFLGGCFLTPTIICLMKKSSFSKYNFWGYPLSWCLSFIIFFSFMSTKLPNYTWPVWISLCILASMLTVLNFSSHEDNITTKTFHPLKYLLFFCPILLCIILFSASNIIVTLVNHLNLDPRVKIVMDSVLPIPFNVKIAFIFSGIILCASTYFCFKFNSASKKYFQYIFAVCFCNALFIFVICTGVMPFVKNVYWLPYVRSSQFVQNQIVKQGGSFATMGLNSPTVSSSFTLNYIPQYSKLDDDVFTNKTTFILLPKWLENKCLEYNYLIVNRDYYLTVCQRRG